MASRILCKHGRPYPCTECIEESPPLREEREEHIKATRYGQTLASAQATANTLRGKLTAGDWIGCFECKALDSTHVGQRMLLVFGREAFDGYLLGMQAPHTSTFGPGWKFRLDVKTESPDDAAAWLHRVGDYK